MDFLQNNLSFTLPLINRRSRMMMGVQISSYFSGLA